MRSGGCKMRRQSNVWCDDPSAHGKRKWGRWRDRETEWVIEWARAASLGTFRATASRSKRALWNKHAYGTQSTIILHPSNGRSMQENWALRKPNAFLNLPIALNAPLMWWLSLFDKDRDTRLDPGKFWITVLSFSLVDERLDQLQYLGVCCDRQHPSE